MKKIAITLALLLFTINSLAATYYVATNGSDSRSTAEAQSISTPWLTIQKALDNVTAGDTVYIRAGTYREECDVDHASGSSGNPITIAAYPGETVIVDGSTVLTSWAPCLSDEAGLTRGGTINPNYANIYKTTVSESTIPYTSSSGNRVFLYLDGITQELTAEVDNDIIGAHNFAFDGWPTADAASTSSTLVDTSELTSTDSGYYDDCIILLEGDGNSTIRNMVAGFNPDTDTISYNYSITTEPSPKYLIMGHPHDLDEAGEYFHTYAAAGSGGDVTIYYWPEDTDDLTDGSLSYSTKSLAFNATSSNNDWYVWDGLEIRGYSAAVGSLEASGAFYSAYNYPMDGWEIKNCNIHDMMCNAFISSRFRITTGSSIHDCTFSNNIQAYGSGLGGNAIMMKPSGTYHPQVDIYDCTFSGDFSSTIIKTNSLTNSLIYNNIITADTGAHGNAISLYADAKNVIFAYNYSYGTNNRLAFKDVGTETGYANGVLIYSNIFGTTTENTRAVALWSGDKMEAPVKMLNNLIFTTQDYEGLLLGSGHSHTGHCYNNIIQGVPEYGDVANPPQYYTFNKNIHFELTDSYGFETADFAESGYLENDYLYDGLSGRQDPNSTVTNWGGLDYTNGDFDLVADANAIDEGADISSLLTDWETAFPGFDFNRDLRGNTIDPCSPQIGPLAYTSAPGNDPCTPISPDPNDGQSNVELTQELSWTDTGDLATSFDVYFGTDGNSLPKVSTVSDPCYTPSLAYDSQYYWKVTSKNSYGSATSAVWDFNTITAPTSFSCPDFTGSTYAEAVIDIGNYGLVVGTVEYQNSDTVTSDYIISQDPAAEELVEPGYAIDLFVSTGPAQTQEEAPDTVVVASVTNVVSDRTFSIGGSMLTGSYRRATIVIDQAGTGKRGIALVTAYNESTKVLTINRSVGFTPATGDTVKLVGYSSSGGGSLGF